MESSKTNHKPFLTLQVYTPAIYSAPVYIVGNFNNWKTRDERYQLKPIKEGLFEFSFDADTRLPYPLEYKFTRGDWDQVELDVHGNSTSNRQLYQPQGIIKNHVPRWSQSGKSYQDRFLPNIEVLSNSFDLPKDIKTRRIAAMLPHDYHQTNKRYPVLYLQDGQNLFDDHAPYGNWAVDKRLAILSEIGQGDVIVVAIDHAAEERIAEFTPSHRTKLGVGEGKNYVSFLTKTLKPYIDQRFRTIPDRDHTGIGGSSMGGLISMYAGLKYPEIYSKLMIFSPSLWVDPDIAIRADEYFATFATKIYIYAGEQESPTMLPNIQRFTAALKKNRIDESNISFQLSVDPKGDHNEYRWGIEFPKAIEWLFFKTAESE